MLLPWKTPVLFITEGFELYDADKLSFENEIKAGQVILLDKKVIDLPSIVTTIVSREVKVLVFQDCGFDVVESREMLQADMTPCTTLEELQFINCRDEFEVMRSCLGSRNLQKVINTKHQKIWRRFDIGTLPKHLEIMSFMLGSHYRLTTFSFEYLDDYLRTLTMNRLVKTVMEAKKRIAVTLQRNLAGYRRCRQTIYTLFLIKKYSNNSLMRLMDRNILVIIGKLVLESLGSPIWCDQ